MLWKSRKVRLLTKNPNNLNDLPEGFNTKDELVSMILDDPTAIIQIKNKSEIPSDSFKELHKILIDNMFYKTTWQLTKYGCSFLMGHYSWYNIDVTGQESKTGKVLLNFSQIINGPWYLDQYRLVLWNQPMYFEIQIFNGDIKNFVDFYVPKIT